MRKSTIPRYDTDHVRSLLESEKTTKTTTNLTQYKIDRNIVMPKPRKTHLYPLLHLEVGDSFAVPVSDSKSLRAAIHRVQVRSKLKFATRTMTARGRGGKQLRVWRVTS